MTFLYLKISNFKLKRRVKTSLFMRTKPVYTNLIFFILPKCSINLSDGSHVAQGSLLCIT